MSVRARVLGASVFLALLGCSTTALAQATTSDDSGESPSNVSESTGAVKEKRHKEEEKEKHEWEFR